ncbi:MAG: class I SAM-dependent methyltransferase [Patescibacteria group bacterium]
MAQKNVWDNEYKKNLLVTLGNEPQASVKEFLRFLRKNHPLPENAYIIDLGSGTGRNAIHLAELGYKAVGIEISPAAVAMAKERSKNLPPSQVTFTEESIGGTLNFPDNAFDLALDVTSSNSLNEAERAVFLKETHRILKPGAFFFVRALCKDGDKNAQTLMKDFPGPEKDTYVMPETNIIERAFSKKDFEELYSPFFEILYIDKETHYTKMNNRSYKRNFWIAYLKKR